MSQSIIGGDAYTAALLARQAVETGMVLAGGYSEDAIGAVTVA